MPGTGAGRIASWRRATAVLGVAGILVLGVGSSPASATLDQLPPSFLQSFSGNPAFTTLSGVAVVDGNLLVIDQATGHISRLSAADGDEVQGWGTTGTGAGQFVGPSGIAGGDDGHLLIADTGNHRVQDLDLTTGQFVPWGSEGSGDGEFEYPSAVAVDSLGNVYVTDSNNNRVQKFQGDGTYVDQWGGFGTGDSQFDGPNGIAVDGDDHIYVSDFGNDRVEVFDTTGALLDQWGASGTGNGQFDEPAGVGIDGHGDVYVVDGNNDRVQKFRPNGTYLTEWSALGAPGTHLDQPDFVAFGPAGLVYVTDRTSGDLAVFRNPLPRPDGRIRKGTGAFVGDGVVNTTGLNQTRTAAIGAGGSVTFTVRAENRGNLADGLRVTGTASTSRFTISYRRGAANITSQVTAGTYVLAAVPVGATRDITVVVTARPTAPHHASVTAALSIISTASAPNRDVVKAVVTRN